MTDTPTPGAAAELPEVWRVGEFISSARCPEHVLMLAVGDQQIAEYGAHRDFIRWVSGDTKSQLDALREEVARLTKERDELRAIASQRGSDIMRLSAQPTDVDALMALAYEWVVAERQYERGNTSHKECEAAREALRAKLAARKENL